MLAAGVSYYCAAGLFLEVDEPAWRPIGLAIVVCLLLLIPFPNPYLMVLGLTTIILCLLEIGRLREHPRGSDRARYRAGGHQREVLRPRWRSCTAS